MLKWYTNSKGKKGLMECTHISIAIQLCLLNNHIHTLVTLSQRFCNPLYQTFCCLPATLSIAIQQVIGHIPCMHSRHGYTGSADVFRFKTKNLRQDLPFAIVYYCACSNMGACAQFLLEYFHPELLMMHSHKILALIKSISKALNYFLPSTSELGFCMCKLTRVFSGSPLSDVNSSGVSDSLVSMTLYRLRRSQKKTLMRAFAHFRP